TRCTLEVAGTMVAGQPCGSTFYEENIHASITPLYHMVDAVRGACYHRLCTDFKKSWGGEQMERSIYRFARRSNHTATSPCSTWSTLADHCFASQDRILLLI